MPKSLFVLGYFIPTFDRGCADVRTPDKILTRATAVLKLLQHFSKKHIHSFNPKTNFLQTVLTQTGEKKVKWHFLQGNFKSRKIF